MVRPYMRVSIPQEYKDNESKGLCKVCGKSKDKFEKGRRLYCGDDCYWKYQDCFLTWNKLRERVLKKFDSCIKCNSKSQLQVDHIIAIMNGGKAFEEENLQVLCYPCHKSKTLTDFKKSKSLKIFETDELYPQNKTQDSYKPEEPRHNSSYTSQEKA